MQAIALDFSGRPRPPGPAAWLLLAAGLLVAAPALDGHLAARERIDRLETRAERQKALAGRERQRLAASPGRTAGAADEALRGHLARLAGELALPWDGVLEALELSLDRQIALLSLAGDGKGRLLRLEGEAKTLADALAFADRLKDSLRFDEVALVSVEARPAGPVQVIRFQLTAAWSRV